jgi:hypothetical protein
MLCIWVMLDAGDVYNLMACRSFADLLATAFRERSNDKKQTAFLLLLGQCTVNREKEAISTVGHSILDDGTNLLSDLPVAG